MSDDTTPVTKEEGITMEPPQPEGATKVVEEATSDSRKRSRSMDSKDEEPTAKKPQPSSSSDTTLGVVKDDSTTPPLVESKTKEENKEEVAVPEPTPAPTPAPAPAPAREPAPTPAAAELPPGVPTGVPTPVSVVGKSSSSNEEGVVEEKDTVPSMYVGRVIGKGGEMIRDLQARSGCRIDVDQNVPVGAPRIITYRGTRKTVDFAKQLVSILCSATNNNSKELPLGEATRQHLIVPTSVIGKIIGRGGDMIRELQAKSGAKIQVDHSGAGGVDDPSMRQVTVTGTDLAVLKADEMIRFLIANPNMDAMAAIAMLIRDKSTPGGTTWGSGPPYPNMPKDGANMQGRDGYGHGHATTNPSSDVEIFKCAKQYMGRIIGQKGVTINDLQKRSGCDLQINQDVPPGHDCEITIKGGNIEQAKRMLQDILTLGPNHPYAGGNANQHNHNNRGGHPNPYGNHPYPQHHHSPSHHPNPHHHRPPHLQLQQQQQQQQLPPQQSYHSAPQYSTSIPPQISPPPPQQQQLWGGQQPPPPQQQQQQQQQPPMGYGIPPPQQQQSQPYLTTQQQQSYPGYNAAYGGMYVSPPQPPPQQQQQQPPQQQPAAVAPPAYAPYNQQPYVAAPSQQAFTQVQQQQPSQQQTYSAPQQQPLPPQQAPYYQQQPPNYLVDAAVAPQTVAAPTQQVWKTAQAPDGQTYYYNEKTGETSWDKPPGMP